MCSLTSMDSVTVLTRRWLSAQILRTLGHLHLLYVCPNDFSERNDVQNRDAFRLINFRDVDEEHQCLREGASLYEGEYEPKMSQIGCADLYEIGQELALWKSSEPGTPPLHLALVLCPYISPKNREIGHYIRQGPHKTRFPRARGHRRTLQGRRPLPFGKSR